MNCPNDRRLDLLARIYEMILYWSQESNGPKDDAGERSPPQEEEG